MYSAGYKDISCHDVFTYKVDVSLYRKYTDLLHLVA